MDNLGLIVIIAVIVLTITVKVIKKRKRDARKNYFLTNGIPFEAYIIGVAHPEAVIKVAGIPNNTYSSFLGIEAVNVSYGRKLFRKGGARVKISYIDPITKQPYTVHRVLNSDQYEDNRICRVSVGGTNLNEAAGILFNYNEKIHAKYRQDVFSRNLTKAEEKQLFKEAMNAMVAYQTHQDATDHENYTILNPPVSAEGYMIGDETFFLQKTNTPILYDWTVGLR